jgi:hypothetical protein
MPPFVGKPVYTRHSKIVMRGDPMRTRILCATLGIALIVSTSAQPQKTMVWDFGLISCGLWLEIRARNDASDVRFVQGREWISGFITAYNWYERPVGGNISAGTDREGMYAWLDKYCRENPTTLVAFAVTKLIEHLHTRQ